MKAWQPILRLARKNLYLLGIVLVLCAVVVAGTESWATKVKAALEQLQASVQAQQDQLTAKQNDLLNMHDHIKRYEVLRAQGMVGSPDRAQWVEQLQASYHDLGFAGRIGYQLQAPQPLVDTAAQAAGTNGEGSVTQFHDLKFEMRQGNEGDLINLISHYRDSVNGRFRVQSCALGDAKDDGLNANCVLRFLSVPLPAPASAPDAPPN
jgi:hypothetical protein